MNVRIFKIEIVIIFYDYAMKKIMFPSLNHRALIIFNFRHFLANCQLDVEMSEKNRGKQAGLSKKEYSKGKSLKLYDFLFQMESNNL